jgi:hypothetical protein
MEVKEQYLFTFNNEISKTHAWSFRINKSSFLITTQNSHDSSHRSPNIVELFSVEASANP